jgi:propionyl-CoA synthetase
LHDGRSRVVGHSYAVYGPLLAGCTTVLFEGSAVGTPDAAALWRLCDAHRIAVLFTAPSALRAARQEDPMGALAPMHDLSVLRAIFLAGERSDAATIQWVERATGVPAIDHWWQTETGWAIAGGFAGLAQTPRRAARSGARATPGFDVRVRDEDGREVAPGVVGELTLRLPLPPGCMTTLWRAEDKTRDIYFARFAGSYRTFDLGCVDAEGRVCVVSRSDDVLKVAGRRISGGLIEEVLASHPDVIDCAVVGVPNKARGEVPVAFIVLRHGACCAASIRADLVRLVRERIGRFTGFRQVTVVATLPRTKSGKILRRALARCGDSPA